VALKHPLHSWGHSSMQQLWHWSILYTVGVTAAYSSCGTEASSTQLGSQQHAAVVALKHPLHSWGHSTMKQLWHWSILYTVWVTAACSSCGTEASSTQPGSQQHAAVLALKHPLHSWGHWSMRHCPASWGNAARIRYVNKSKFTLYLAEFFIFFGGRGLGRKHRLFTLGDS
jgi:hypothetical protein